jgi:hypothetical protein
MASDAMRAFPFDLLLWLKRVHLTQVLDPLAQSGNEHGFLLPPDPADHSRRSPHPTATHPAAPNATLRPNPIATARDSDPSRTFSQTRHPTTPLTLGPTSRPDGNCSAGPSHVYIPGGRRLPVFGEGKNPREAASGGGERRRRPIHTRHISTRAAHVHSREPHLTSPLLPLHHHRTSILVRRLIIDSCC